MTIAEALKYGTNRLHMRLSPMWDARFLLQHTLKVNRSYLISHDKEWLTSDQFDSYLALLERASKHEPLPYLAGTAPFRDMELAVTPATLIPRPETEQLVDLALAWCGEKAVKICDIGTGSGCIAISLARALPNAEVSAVDISESALKIAQQNAEKYDAAVQFHHGSLLDPLTETNCIVANLPYITDTEYGRLPQGIRTYEPATALQGGQDGLDLIRTLLTQAQTKLSPNGAIFLEIGYKQGKATKELAQATFPHKIVTIHKDFAQNDRIVEIR